MATTKQKTKRLRAAAPAKQSARDASKTARDESKVAKTAEIELACATQDHWDKWLSKHHATSSGVWLVLHKKVSSEPSVTYLEAVETALAWGWIDAKKMAKDEISWVQRFTQRTAKSPWSKINRDKALALIASGAMRPPGLAEVERAQKDGRWEAAYDSAKTSTVPDDLAKALGANRRAAAFFDKLDRTNRYAILYRVQTAKKPETRAARIAQFVDMMARGETLHPPRKQKSLG
jgi:uncharacterized protein YdeI (YjbR/CyaY-like superfamily)